LRKELSVAEMILGVYFEGRPGKYVSKLMIGVTEKSGKNN
jgi:hypothetical protein